MCLSGAVGGAADLELFLFGGARVDLAAARGALQDMQENRCFYCGSAMKQDPHVDHFIPWSRYPRDLAQNFVLALGLRPSRGHVGAALGEPEIHGQCRPEVPGDTRRVTAGCMAAASFAHQKQNLGPRLRGDDG